MKCVIYANTYSTAKTTTTEVVYVSDLGMLSLKAMKMDRGGIKVYTGFDPIPGLPVSAREFDIEELTTFREHRYIKSFLKNAVAFDRKRYMQRIDRLDGAVMPPGIEADIKRAILSQFEKDDESGRHLYMLIGDATPEASATKKAPSDVAVDHSAKRQDHYAHDDMYGIF